MASLLSGTKQANKHSAVRGVVRSLPGRRAAAGGENAETKKARRLSRRRALEGCRCFSQASEARGTDDLLALVLSLRPAAHLLCLLVDHELILLAALKTLTAARKFARRIARGMNNRILTKGLPFRR
jgi:hypothetical protein